ncbi:spermatogenesis-associated protein 16 isoform X2 [Anolis carolinensis]|uniref:spermatogenesis-associated protein 16 isoform X2 n=1 Tax=Anolis carolinensis TaxID=28377 RepID=UPI002F2B5708
METASNSHFENITNEICQKEYLVEEARGKTYQQNDILEALQEGKSPSGGETIEIVMEKLKTEKNSIKEKQSHDADRLSLKRKSESDEKLILRKEPRLSETDFQPLPILLPHIPLKSLMEVEIKLVYMDEEDVTYEFLESQLPTNEEPKYSVATSMNSQRASDTSIVPPQMDKWLQVALKDASTCYRQKKYAMAAGQFRTALELCSKGAALGKPFEASPKDISSIASFIETKLVICYLKMRKPDLALNHSHRSIMLNPAYFRNHLRQAAVFRSLERYSEAARSTMVADYIYWLSGGREQHTSKLIKLYWQAMIEEAITRAECFSVMYTPFATKIKAENIEKLKEAFTKKHPDYVEYIYTDPHGLHSLPQTADWSCPSPQTYLLTLGFRNKEVGKFLEKMSCRKLPTFSDHKAPFSPLTKEEAGRHLETIGKRILPIMDFIRGTKLTVGIIEDFLYQLEDSFLKTKKLRTARRQKMKMKRLQSEQPC